jgi:hypothetical protein
VDLAAVFLLSLLGGYFFVYTWRLTAYSTRRVEGHHLYFRAAFCGVVFFAIALLLRRLLLENVSYAHIDADLIKYVTPVLKDDSSTPHPVESELTEKQGSKLEVIAQNQPASHYNIC